MTPQRPAISRFPLTAMLLALGVAASLPAGVHFAEAGLSAPETVDGWLKVGGTLAAWVLLVVVGVSIARRQPGREIAVFPFVMGAPFEGTFAAPAGPSALWLEFDLPAVIEPGASMYLLRRLRMALEVNGAASEWLTVSHAVRRRRDETTGTSRYRGAPLEGYREVDYLLDIRASGERIRARALLRRLPAGTAGAAVRVRGELVQPEWLASGQPGAVAVVATTA